MRPRDRAHHRYPCRLPSASDPRRRHPVAIAATAVALLLLGLIAGRDAISGTERSVFEVFNGLASWWWLLLFPVMQVGTLLAGPAAALIAEFAGKRLLAIELLAAGVGGWLIARGLKVLVSRPRPAFLLDDVVIRGGAATGLGYPSGHVTVATALVTVLAAWLPRRWEAPLWVIVVLVGMGRMYTGAHLPLDVVGGALLGALIGAGVRMLSHATLFARWAEPAAD